LLLLFTSQLKIFIKNMVCIRCKMVVKLELDKLGLHYRTVELGEVEIMENLTDKEMQHLLIFA
jgi:hypothetical protein